MPSIAWVMACVSSHAKAITTSVWASPSAAMTTKKPRDADA